MRVPFLKLLPIKPPASAKNVTPLYLEFHVDAATSPSLVSSSRDLVWVTDEQMDEAGRIRAAVRSMGKEPDEFNRDVLSAIEVLARTAEWGNVQPHTRAGVAQAVAHVQTYGLGDLEILALDETKKIYQGHGPSVIQCSWLPSAVALVVPKERDFLGVLGQVGKDLVVVLVHNAARGIAIYGKAPASTTEKGA